jgi:CelD/BcsL family acetyltransferase involved in cellulose biosynthesis
MTLRIEAFETERAFDILREEWHELIAYASRRNLFTTWEWQSNWWAAYHPGHLWILTVRDEGGLLVGLAPWFIDEDHPKGRLVRSIGCVDVTDYLELILREGYEEEVLQALTAYVVECFRCYDALDFCNIPEDSPQLTLWQPILEAAGFTVTITQQEVCPVIRLPETVDDFIQSLSKKDRHELRRKMRRAKGGEHQVSWFMVQPRDDLTEMMERFLKLMRASSPDKATFLDDPQNVAFFRRVLPVMMEQGWLAMSFLQIDGQDAAAYVSFDYDNRIMLYNSGLDPRRFAELSPGIVLLVYIIEDAILKKRAVFDFLRGNEDYKYRLGGVDTAVMTLHARLN